jgi:hypothetical protein
MATNTGDGYRKATISNYVQVLNPATGHYIKMDTETGRILEVKPTKFKGVRLKATKAFPNPSVKRSTALKAEKAVIAYRNKHSNKP